MVISKNMEALVAGSSVIRKLFEEGLEMAKVVGKENVYDFSLGNPASPVPKKVGEEIARILKEEPLGKVHGYMPNAGFPEVREKVAKSLNARFGMGYDGGDILMSVGAAGGMNCVFRAMLNPGDEVIAFAPFFGEYRNYVANYGGTLTVVPPDIPAFQLNLEALESRITEKTRAVIVNNPNNPSGVIYKEETIQKLGEVLAKAEAKYGRPVYVICDEPYRELAYGGKTVPYIPKYIKNSIYLYSFSKTLSLPGERIGYLALSKEAEGHDELMPALVCANRILGYVNAPSLFQLVVGECLEEPVDLEFYDRNRKLLYEKLTGMGFSLTDPEGAFYFLIKSPVPDEEVFVNKAKEFHILLVNTKSFGLPGYVRLAYCVSYDMIERSLGAFEKLAEAFKLG